MRRILVIAAAACVTLAAPARADKVASGLLNVVDPFYLTASKCAQANVIVTTATVKEIGVSISRFATEHGLSQAEKDDAWNSAKQLEQRVGMPVSNTSCQAAVLYLQRTGIWSPAPTPPERSPF